MNETTRQFHLPALHVLALVVLYAGIAPSCAGTGSSFGMTRAASAEGRRALDIECAGAFSFSPDGQYMASSNGRNVRVRKSPSGRPEETFDVRDDVSPDAGTCVVFSPDSRWLAVSAHANMAVKVFDMKAWKEHAQYLVDNGRVGAIAFSSDGEELAIGTSSSMIELIDLQVGGLQVGGLQGSGVQGGGRRVLRKAHVASPDDSKPISFLAYGVGDRTLLADAGGDVIEIDRKEGDILWSRFEERVLALAPDGRRLIAVSVSTGLARLYDLQPNMEPVLLCTIHDPAGASVAQSAVFSPVGGWFAVGFARNFVGANWQELEFYGLTPIKVEKPVPAGTVVETMRAEPIRSLRAGEPKHITISPDGKLLCLCTVPIAAIYELSYLLPKGEL